MKMTGQRHPLETYHYPFMAPELVVPLDMLRAHLHPRAPHLTQPAVQQYLDSQPEGYQHPIYMPKRMGFRRWKSNPHHGPMTSWESVVTSPLRAMYASIDMLQKIRERVPGPRALTPRDAALQRGALKVPETRQHSLDDAAITKGAPENIDRVPPIFLHELARQQSRNPGQAQANVEARTSRFNERRRAMGEALHTYLAYTNYGRR